MKQEVKVINGVRYYTSRPNDCRFCFFWKNKKVGCILKTENCYYLASPVLTKQEEKCQGCSYAKDGVCVSASCYRELDHWLNEKRKERKDE